MTPEQSRAGRALVDLSSSDLAMSAGLDPKALADYEAGRERLPPGAEDSLRRALLAAGVVMIDPDLDGPGVRLRRPHSDEGMRPEELHSGNDD